VQTLNLGILAHVDAGKTSLTERLLYAAGIVDEPGSVDDGSTQTDSLALERQRGITIRAAVVSFAIDDVTVNLIDTPGHPDFIAEVERALAVLDGAVLVVSAVEGVQAQTRVLMRTLQRLRLPTLLFVNKIDRAGAHDERTLRAVAEKLTPAIVAMGSVDGVGTRGARFTPHTVADRGFTARLAEVLADHDEALLAAYLDDETDVAYPDLRRALAGQTKQARVHPVYFGSAITGAGVDDLAAGIRELLPAAQGDVDGPVSGTVFKVDRGPTGEKLAYVRMFSGTLRTRERLRLPGDDDGAKVTAISVFDRGSAVARSSVAAGQIGRLRGLESVSIGDAIGRPPVRATPRAAFAPPTLETVVVPDRAADRGALHVALTQLAEQDPLIGLRQDALRGELSLCLYGEVQKEVIEATLADEYAIAVTFRETTTIFIERVAGTGEAVELLGADPNPFLATVGLRIEPAPIGSGVRFDLEVELGSMPLAFIRAVEISLRQALRQGLHGWEVTDCAVAMTDSGYAARQSHSHATFDKSMSSTARDFRQLTPLVAMTALKQAGTTVCEPVHRFTLELPPDTLGATAAALAALGGAPLRTERRGAASVVDGEIPAARVHELTRQLPSLARGEGVLESAFERYEPVRGAVPTRPRTDDDPLDRREYIRRVLRVGGAQAGP
jgi:ribosomal protection tetracycline resistance protein